MAIDRVAERVRQGGHGVPADVIRRHFVAGLRNFEQVYCDAVDAWAIYDCHPPRCKTGGASGAQYEYRACRPAQRQVRACEAKSKANAPMSRHVNAIGGRLSLRLRHW
jgi:predicted ABC-type ATPase